MKKKSKANQSRGRPHRISVSVDEKIFMDLQEMSLMTGFSISELVYLQLQFRKIFFVTPYTLRLQTKLCDVVEEYLHGVRNCGDCQRICDDIKIAITEFRSILPTLSIGNIEVPSKMMFTKERSKKQKKGTGGNGGFIVTLKGKSNVETG